MTHGTRDWTTEWWAGRGGALGSTLDAVLWPAEAVFRGLATARVAAYERGWLRSESATIPVVSIGNLTVGGAGKTPVAAWVARHLADRGAAPALVLRGYGADEVLVHGELNPDVPVFTAARRVEGVAAAVAAGCGVAVLDDGFQHLALARDLDVVLVAAESWDQRRRLLPRGPWRERITALRRADVLIVTRKWVSAERAAQIAYELGAVAPDVMVATCYLAPTGFSPLHAHPAPIRDREAIRDLAVLAVASVGNPSAFARQLELMGATVDLVAFPDHHAFDAADARSIADRAGARVVVMTRKDAVKLRGLLPESVHALVSEQRVILEVGEAALRDALRLAVDR